MQLQMVNASEMDPDRSRSSVTMQGRFGHGEFTVAHASHVGCVRRNNEDSVAVHESLGLGIVADGIGGQPGGEVASRRAVHAIARHVASGAGLVDAISLASRDLARAGRRQGNSRPGTTVVATRLVGNAFRVAWVGDSRAYLLADSVVRLTHDHSFVNVLKASGRISDDELLEVERTAIPGPGACGGMYTANTMASAIEALGMSLPGATSNLAVDEQNVVSRDKQEDCVRAAKAVIELLQSGLTSRDIMTRQAFENALTVAWALGGSTNAVLHLLALAHEADVDLTLEDIDRITSRRAPIYHSTYTGRPPDEPAILEVDWQPILEGVIGDSQRGVDAIALV